jgi:hypothetical protein
MVYDPEENTQGPVEVERNVTFKKVAERPNANGKAVGLLIALIFVFFALLAYGLFHG